MTPGAVIAGGAFLWFVLWLVWELVHAPVREYDEPYNEPEPEPLRPDLCEALRDLLADDPTPHGRRHWHA